VVIILIPDLGRNQKQSQYSLNTLMQMSFDYSRATYSRALQSANPSWEVLLDAPSEETRIPIHHECGFLPTRAVGFVALAGVNAQPRLRGLQRVRSQL
jgi:hypothetical protein